MLVETCISYWDVQYWMRGSIYTFICFALPWQLLALRRSRHFDVSNNCVSTCPIAAILCEKTICNAAATGFLTSKRAFTHSLQMKARRLCVCACTFLVLGFSDGDQRFAPCVFYDGGHPFLPFAQLWCVLSVKFWRLRLGNAVVPPFLLFLTWKLDRAPWLRFSLEPPLIVCELWHRNSLFMLYFSLTLHSVSCT